MVHLKNVNEELFRELRKNTYTRYVCGPLPSGRVNDGDLIVMQEVDKAGVATGRLSVGIVLSVVGAESEYGPRLVIELELKHTQGGAA